MVKKDGTSTIGVFVDGDRRMVVDEECPHAYVITDPSAVFIQFGQESGNADVYVTHEDACAIADMLMEAVRPSRDGEPRAIRLPRSLRVYGTEDLKS